MVCKHAIGIVSWHPVWYYTSRRILHVKASRRILVSWHTVWYYTSRKILHVMMLWQTFFPCVVDNRNIFWVTSMIYCFVRRCCIVAVAPLPTTHPKLKLATGMSAWKRPLAVQHMKIYDYIFHGSYVAQWQSVWPRNMRSSVRITVKPMVLKVRRKIEEVEVVIRCHVWSVWSWALDGRSVSNVD